MTTVSINRCPIELQRILQAAEERDVVLRTPKGGEVLLSLIDDFDYEIAVQRRNPELMAFLNERSQRARMEKGIPLEEVSRRLGLPRRSHNDQRSASNEQRTPLRRIGVSRRSQALLALLEKARSVDIILKTADGSECFVAAIYAGDYKAANRHRSEMVMAYLDEQGDQGKLPPLEVVFVRQRPLRFRGRTKKMKNPK